MTSTTLLSFPTGKHTLKIKVRENGALIDKIMLTKDGAFTPTGLGGTALACNGPFAPTGLMATPGNGSAALSWNPVVGATSYTVKRSTTSGSGYMTVQSGITGDHVQQHGAHQRDPVLLRGLGVERGQREPELQRGAGHAGGRARSGPARTSARWRHRPAPGARESGGASTPSRAAAPTSGARRTSSASMYQQLSGDGTITARVTELGRNNATPSPRPGVMMRQTPERELAARAGRACPPQGHRHRWSRPSSARTAGATSVSETGPSPTLPALGAGGRGRAPTLTAFQSTNGTNFTQLGTPSTITGMTGTVFVGLAVTSHADGTNGTATFDNVSITTPDATNAARAAHQPGVHRRATTSAPAAGPRPPAAARPATT